MYPAIIISVILAATDAGTNSELGLLCRRHAQYAEAETHYLRALRALETTNAKPAVVASVLNALASLYIDAHEYGKAERVCRRAAAIDDATTQRDSLESTVTLLTLASLDCAEKKYD